MAHDIDSSKVGKALLEVIRKKQEFDSGESVYKQELLKRVINNLEYKGANPQKVLDSEYFNSLSLTEKVNFINQHKDLLSKTPKFAWGKVFQGAAEGAGFAGIGTFGHQLTANLGKGPFRINRWAMGGALGMGALVGSLTSYARESKDYRRDLASHRNIDDAISMLVQRGLVKVPDRVAYSAKVRSKIEEMPVEYGKTLSGIDFSKLHPQNQQK